MKKHFLVTCTYLLAVILSVGMLTSGKPKQVNLYLCGDETCADVKDCDASTLRGWGQLLPSYFDGEVVVRNHAVPGCSSRSYLEDGRWQYVLESLHKGDIVMLQFGGNDAQQGSSHRHASVSDYEKNMMKMIADAQKEGVKVIVCTPVARRYFVDGELRPRLGAYPEAARRVARAMEVPMIDLEQSSREWLTQQGDSASQSNFAMGGESLTEQGALAVAGMFVGKLTEQKLKPLSKHVVVADTVAPKLTVFCRPDLKTLE